MTKQEYYDLLVKSATDGTFPSAQGVRCLFRKDRTAHCPQRCAVGLLIPDEKYHEGLEDISIDKYSGDYEERIWGAVEIPEGITRMDLVRIQKYHDDAYSSWLGPVRGNFVSRFVSHLNNESCFADCVKKEVPCD